MKQYLSPEQTAKMIELGVEPKNERWVLDVANESTPSIQNIVKRQDYSIGELIEMLPTIFDDFTLWIGRDERSAQWFVKYHPRTLKIGDELIDALYAMILQLKEKGVI